MSKLFNDISRMNRIIKVIEQYNNFKQLGIEDDIEYLKKRVDELYTIKDSTKLVDSFTWCAKMLNSYYEMIDYEFKKNFLKEEEEENEFN